MGKKQDMQSIRTLLLLVLTAMAVHGGRVCKDEYGWGQSWNCFGTGNCCWPHDVGQTCMDHKPPLHITYKCECYGWCLWGTWNKKSTIRRGRRRTENRLEDFAGLFETDGAEALPSSDLF